MSSPLTNMFPGVALVTGAASGIGQATAVSFAKEGCPEIVIADRNDDGLDETTSRIHEAAPDCAVLSIRTDVSDQDSVQALIDKAVEAFGRLDYVCNSAGTLSNNERSHETSLEEFDRINKINYKGCWLCSRAEIQQMLKQEPLPTHDGRRGNRGSVVNIASQLGIVGRPAAPAYCGSKAAVISMTRCDYSKDNIRVNCVCPGVIETPMTTPNMDVLGPAISIAPMNRPGTAQEVADCVLFLCSSKATFVQGSAMVVDGGYVIN
ncbi:NAD(P)-binding protein [Hortaea werneckii]|nr:NAD(P)-binding protein [Hortaea werneckii]KAI7610062.1 NAD(P)-binding protein [Hortaea werneckii]KAI7616235.1 NAD(P)-binding protein [Hortaea werneckii]KAI7671175.1 NAD(P)-binding protein [Hortaea werneckii]KAI7698704.1 NAD(P)-binding protein [Hortaea werneckii]